MNSFPSSGPANPIRVVLADSSRLSCQLLAREFKRRRCGIDVVGYAGDSASLLSLLSETSAHVVVMRASLRDGYQTGSLMIRSVLSAHPCIHVILLLDNNESDLVVQAFRRGAHGIFCGDENFDALCKCIESVMRGQIWASSREIGYLLEALCQPPTSHITSTKGEILLTPREEEVVRLVCDGLTNKDISIRLNLSEHTVRNYLYRIFEKLGISSRVELILRTFSQEQKPGSNHAHVRVPDSVISPPSQDTTVSGERRA
jgi:DNA-binding NarL/FixJ family response regulator